MTLDGATSDDVLLGLDVENNRFSDDELSSIVDEFGADDISDDEMLSFLDEVLGEKRKEVPLVIEDLEYDSAFLKKRKLCNTSKNHASTLATDDQSEIMSANSDDVLRWI